MQAIAAIDLLDDNEKKTGGITVQYNPSEITVEQSATYTAQKQAGKADNIRAPQFVSSNSATLRFKLTCDGFTKAGTLDETKAASVTGDIDFLRKLVVIDERLHHPPLCRFVWGSMSFTGYAESLSVNYTMFSSEGKAIRATAALSVRNVTKKAPALQSPDRTKRYIVTEGALITDAAFAAYDDPAEWRRIADANGIRNPRRLAAGAVLTIPPWERERDGDF